MKTALIHKGKIASLHDKNKATNNASLKNGFGFVSLDKDNYAQVGHTVSNDVNSDFKAAKDKLVAVAVVANDEAKRVIALQEHAAHLQSQILQVSQDKKNYYTSKSAIALNSLTNPALLSQFEYEANTKGVTTEQVRDAVLDKANSAYTAFADIENSLKRALDDLSSAKTVKAKDKIVADFINGDEKK